jgi:asparagine synthase (glutamine-hydrolysing)
MCGLAGVFGSTSHAHENVVLRMSNAIISRGPDSSGIWVDGIAGVGMSHRRLSIIDLSATGHQPMTSSTGRYVFAYNGEIYNHLNLREKLKGNYTGKTVRKGWSGHSDTESLLAGFEAWGVQATLERCIGMFAFALWDKQTQTLTLGRDRLGEKPLYYGWQGSGEDQVFLFGSELKALKAHPAFNASIDRGALALLLRHNYIPAPHSIYQGIYKLEPGCLLTVSRAQKEPAITRYWSSTDIAVKATVARSARAELGKTDTNQATAVVDELDVLLQSAVKQQMMADVPLGAFLSGGVDSSTVVALMQAQSARPVKTFTIGFSEEGYNEAVHAKAVAAHLGTDHTELYVSPQQAMDVIPKLPHLYCEPFADSSQIPTYLVSQLARQHVTVSLSGDAGDELFAGYNRYQLSSHLWGKLSKVPVPIRRVAASAITALSPSVWTKAASYIPVLNRHPAAASLGDKLHKGAAVLGSLCADDLYLGLVSQIQDPTRWVKGADNAAAIEPATLLTGNKPNLDGLNAVERMMALDAVTYLPDDILCKVDRAGMGVSLEGRVPFLDHRVFEFAWSLPMEYKLREGQTKWALRQVLYRYVPKELIDRPKMGFGIPLHDWLRGPLREWAEALIEESRLEREGYFYPTPIRTIWLAHLSGKQNLAHQLWGILMFQAWLEVNQ